MLVLLLYSIIVIIISHSLLHAGFIVIKKNSTFVVPGSLYAKVHVYLLFLLIIFYEFSTTFPLKNSNVVEAG